MVLKCLSSMLLSPRSDHILQMEKWTQVTQGRLFFAKWQDFKYIIKGWEKREGFHMGSLAIPYIAIIFTHQSHIKQVLNFFLLVRYELD